jgi:predicted ester cyclase/ketosteroid isomerase-like protein
MHFSLILLISFIYISPALTQTTVEKNNIQKVRIYWNEVWEKGNLQAVADFYHPNAKHGDDFTIEGFQKGVQSQREAIPDLKINIIDMFTAGDKVICEVVYKGTHTGRRFFGQDQMAKEINLPGIDIFTFKDGKCVNHQHVADHLPMVRQIGLKLVPTRDQKITEEEIKKASQNYLDVAKRIYSGKKYEDLEKNGDIEAFNQILADEYSYTDPKGFVYNKQEEMKYIKNNSVIIQSAGVKDQKIMVDGNTAIETGVLHYKYLDNNNKPIDYSKRYTTTWIWRGGRWQILADHASKVDN